MRPEKSISFRFLQRNGLLTLLLFTFVLNSFGQSVADVAKKERQRQQTAKSKVVITSNVTTTPPTPNTSTNGAQQPAAPSTGTQTPTTAAKPGEFTDRNGHDEKFWRAAFLKARDDLKRAQQRAELLDLKVKQINTDMLQYSNFYNRENRLGADLTVAQKDLETARTDAAQAQKRLADLEEDLRKAGGPAGWAR